MTTREPERYTAGKPPLVIDPARPLGPLGPPANKYGAICDRCGLPVAAGAGITTTFRAPWRITHRPPRPWRQGQDKAVYVRSGCRAAEKAVEEGTKRAVEEALEKVAA